MNTSARLVGCVAMALLATGCGNQMFRQPSFAPLDTPRASPPADSVPVRVSLEPDDGRPVESPAYGDAFAHPVVAHMAEFPSKEPDLPAPNLSDQARYQNAPAEVDAIKNPLPNDPRLVVAGEYLFLNRCVQCHNPSGVGYGTVGQYLVPHPPDLASPLVQHISNGAMFWHITMGQGKMPGFRHWTTPQERWCLVEYVRSLPKTHGVPDTRGAPYPVYGLPGFEEGRSQYPFKVINPETSDSSSRARVDGVGFGQEPVGAR